MKLGIDEVLYTYRPDEAFFCGDHLGEHFVTYTAVIDNSDPDSLPKVKLKLAVTEFKFSSQLPAQNVNFTEYIKRYPTWLKEIENEIRRDYMSTLKKHWDEVAG